MSVPTPTGVSPCFLGLPRPFSFVPDTCWQSHNPAARKQRFGLFGFRSPLLAESSLFLGLLRCFTSPGSLVLRRAQAFPRAGFPIRIPPAVTVAHTLPGRFAVYRVLHRHVTPRHPPDALICLLQIQSGERDARCFVCLVIFRYVVGKLRACSSRPCFGVVCCASRAAPHPISAHERHRSYPE
jgi:hypothetical protein